MSALSRLPGVEIRHAKSCPARGWQPCSCAPSFRGVVYSARDKRKITSRAFATAREASEWREETRVEIRRGRLRPTAPATVAQVASEWLTAAQAGIVRTRSGHPYKPSALRSYEQALREYVLPALGERPLGQLERIEVQDLVDELVASGRRSPSTVRNAIVPLRAICRRALVRGLMHVNPTTGLELPAGAGQRERIATPGELAALLAALPDHDRALWATASYAGLRRGELQALRWRDIDLERDVITVGASWDRVAGLIEPKSHAGRRSVPIVRALRRELLAHRLRSQNTDAAAYVFATAGGRPFDPATVAERARKAWGSASLSPITLHECRHTFASLMIAADVNAKALQTFMGHSSITVTLDRYGKLMPGSEAQAGQLLDAYLDAQATRR